MTKFRLTKDVVVNQFGDVICLFNPETESMIQLNAMGKEIVDLLKVKRSINDVVTHIVKKYKQIEKDEIVNEDVQKFIFSLVDLNFIVKYE